MATEGICELRFHMWPREVFDAVGPDPHSGKERMLARTLDNLLNRPGVYVLYRDDVPFYVGQAEKMRSRIWHHAWEPDSPYFNFWNFFSAFVIADKSRREEVEGILIAAMPTANSSQPEIETQRLPPEVIKLIRAIRRQKATV